MALSRRSIVGVVLVVLSSCLPGCHSPSGPSGPGPAPVSALSLTCPGDVRVTDVTTPTSTVTYTLPTHAGGVEPIGVTCLPNTGSAFPIGTTAVSCSGADAATPVRTATCQFNVIVTAKVPPVPTISATKFMAFGDSLTLGENGCNDDPCNFTRPPGHDYPTILKGLLTQRYVQQTVSMDNQGQGGHTAAQDVDRLRGLLQSSVPEVLLLLEGVNDFAPGNGGTPSSVAAALREDIRIAKAAGVKHVFISNLTPEIAGGSRAWGVNDGDLLTPTNALIRDVAAQEGATLVDSFRALSTNLEDNVSSPNKEQAPGTGVYGDGLHLTFVGNQVLADTFFQAIKQKLEAGANAAAAIAARPQIRRPGGRYFK